MRLVLKLTVAIVAAMCVVLAVRAYTIVKREAALIESLTSVDTQNRPMIDT